MSFRAETYRVMIGSPSDLGEEREAATHAINDWNAQHAAAEGIVLLPVKWETHAMPQAAVRPQASINQQLVRDSDLLVGMFWTKLGTSTGVAASGTVKEIDEFVAAGKPALLYFSSRPVSPDKIDLKQHKKLRQFKDSPGVPTQRTVRQNATARRENVGHSQARETRLHLQAKMDSIWQYCVSRWVRMVVSTSRRRSRCALDPRWGAVVATVFDHPSEPAVRRRTRGGATAQHALGTVISRLGATGSLPNVVQGDEREFVEAMTPNQREIWLKRTLDEIAGRQSTDAFKQLVLRHGAHDAAVWLAVKLGSGRARFWSVDERALGGVQRSG